MCLVEVLILSNALIKTEVIKRVKNLPFSGKMQEITDIYKSICWISCSPARSSGSSGYCFKGNLTLWEKGYKTTLLGTVSHTRG